MIEPGVSEAGNARCVIMRSETRNEYEMYLLLDINGRISKVSMDDGSFLIEPIEEGIAMSRDDCFVVWQDHEDITGAVTNVFQAMAIALGVAGEVKDAYKMGVLTGENTILREVMKEYKDAIRNAAPQIKPWQQGVFQFNDGQDGLQYSYTNDSGGLTNGGT